jgi:hypothetical protein
MNKYVMFMMMALFMILMTFVAESIDASTTERLSDIAISTDTPGVLNFLTQVWSYLGVFFRMMTFQINGIPAIFNLFVFLPITFGMLYIVVDTIRGNG